jgi:hypothetical protein
MIHPATTVISKTINTKEISKKLNTLDLLAIGLENLNIQSDNKEIISKKTRQYYYETEEIPPIEDD